MLRAVAARRLGAALVAALTGACSHPAPQADGAARDVPATFVLVSGEGEPLPSLDDLEGVVLDIVPGVEYRFEIVQQVPGTVTRLATINRHPLELEDGLVRIGPREYGPVKVGDRVTIRPEGVAINGERAGELPPRPGSTDSDPR